MVRHYHRKDGTMRWMEDDLKKAIAHAKQHRNIKAAARLYKIPVTTLRDKMSGKVKRTQVGHPTALSAEQEEIVDTCILFAEWEGEEDTGWPPHSSVCRTGGDS